MKWFKHMANAADDDFIEWLEEDYGFEGYGRWWRILEIIAKSMEKDRMHPSASHTWSKWQLILKGKRSQLLRYLTAMQQRGKIQIEDDGNILKITCPKMLLMRDEYSRKAGLGKDMKPDRPRPVDKEKEKDTDKGSKKEENPAQAPLDFKKIIFTTGMHMVGGESKRSLVGKWLRDYGEANVVTAFLACEKNKPLNPIEYMEATLKKTGKAPGLFDKPKFDPAKDISNYKVL